MLSLPRSAVLQPRQGLILREWHEGDLEQMAELFDDPQIAFTSRHCRRPSPSTTRTNASPAARQGDRLLLAITRDGAQPLGEVLLTSDGELGYAIGARHRGQGLATRALALPARLRARRDRVSCGAPPEDRAGQRRERRGRRRTPAFGRNASSAEPVENKGRAVTVETWEHPR